VISDAGREQSKLSTLAALLSGGISYQPQDSIFRTTNLQGIRTQYETFVQADRNAMRMITMIDFIFPHPILTIWQLEIAFGMPCILCK
jgi:hypothetical protein